MTQPFIRQFQADCDELVGARWWNEAMQGGRGLLANETTRRNVLLGLGVGAVGLTILVGAASEWQSGGHHVADLDTLVAQRRNGWNVGANGKRLYFYGLVEDDAAGHSDWRAKLGSLQSALAPSSPDLLPYYVPTLFQVLDAPDFYSAVSPIHTSSMDTAAAEALGLANVLRDAAVRGDTALLIDAPGPEAVAAAAALSDVFDPVFLFDNWPHPKGIVPSHEVIAAAIYTRPDFELGRAHRRQGAPPMFVIDNRRLTPYRDDSDAFDNRYLARLPGAASLGQRGVRHLLYVTDLPVDHESDDLNDDFVALSNAGIDVKTVALSDFRPNPQGSQGYTYGGSPFPHYWFWHTYGWYMPAHVTVPRESPPTVLSSGSSYRPAPRSTMFSSHLVGGLGGVGKQKPSGFGYVSVRTERATGAIEIGRSGSFGRSRSFWSGG